jgi:hypothetical protein
MNISVRRPASTTLPRSSIRARSPVRSQPSNSVVAVAAGSRQ